MASSEADGGVVSNGGAARVGARGAMMTIFLIVFIDLMGFGIVLPNLQLYGKRFGIDNYFALVLIGAVYSFFQFLFSPLLGRWSDRIGRRPVLIISQAGTVLGFLILFAAHWFEGGEAWVGIVLIFVSRVVDGMSGGNISVASAYIADITTVENRARGMGMIGAAFGMGFVFGPFIGGVTAKHLGLAFVPLVASGFSVVALVMTVTKLKESLKPGEKTKEWLSFFAVKHALARPVIGPLILMMFVNGFAFAGMEQTFSLLIYRRLFDPTNPANGAGTLHALASLPEAAKDASAASGYLFGFIGIIIVVIQGGLIRRLTKRFGEAPLVIVGPLLIAVGLVFVGAPVDWSWRWTGFMIGAAFMATGSSLFNPAIQALISRHASAAEQGEVLGASQGMASLARALGPVLAGVLFAYVSPAMPYYVSAGITVGVGLVAVGMRGRLRPPVG